MTAIDESKHTVIEVLAEGPQGPPGPAVDPDNVITKSGSFTYSESDAYALIRVETAATITLPSDAPVGSGFMVLQVGTGLVQFAAGAGATVSNDLGNLKIYGQWSVVSVVCHAPGAWVIAGATKA